MAAAKEKEKKDKDSTGEIPLEGIGAQGDDHFFAIATVGPGAPPGSGGAWHQRGSSQEA